MTKEEIIEECKQRLGFETDYEMYSLSQYEKDFYNAIIKTLEQQPSDDCVNRVSVFNMLKDIQSDIEDGYGFQYENWVEEVKDMPPVIPTHKVGKWIEVWESQRDEFTGEYDEWREHKCLVCGFQEYDADRFKYCPYCGAEMRGSENG